MSSPSKPQKPDLHIDVNVEETTPLLHRQSPSRRPTLRSLDTQIHPPAVEEAAPLLAVPAAGQLAPDYDAPASAVSYDEARRRPKSKKPEEEEDGPSMPRGQILLLCYARMIEPIAVGSFAEEIRVTFPLTAGSSFLYFPLSTR